MAIRRSAFDRLRGATITWGVVQQQQNVPMIARLDREVVLAVRAKGPYGLTVENDKVAILQGERLTLPVKVVEAAGQLSL